MDVFAGFVVVRVAAEDVVHVAVHGVFDGFAFHLPTNADPAFAFALEPAADAARAGFAFLDGFVKFAGDGADDGVIG